MKRKVLIVMDKYLPNGGAAANIVSRIIHESSHIRYDVLSSGISETINYSDHFNYFVPSLPCFPLVYALKQVKTLNDLIYIIKRAGQRMFGFMRASWINKSVIDSYSRCIQELKLNFYDAYIAVVASPSMYEAIIDAKKKGNIIGKVILYQIDPIAGNVYHDPEGKMRKYEEDIYKSADCVMCTPTQYKFSPVNIELLKKKAHVIEYPLVRDMTESAHVERNSGKIRCLFSGYVDEKVRNPRYLMGLVQRIQDSDIEFVFCTPGKREYILSHIAHLKESNVTCIDNLSVDEAIELMADAHFLINIGNDCANQLPSKIFDYISTGKPIINIQKKHSAELVYLNKYPAVLNIPEDWDKIDEYARNLKLFLHDSKNRSVDFTTISSIYTNCTQERSGREFERVVLQCIDGKEAH